MEESGIYIHKANDGGHHCSYDLSYAEVESLDLPAATLISSLEYIEGMYLQQEDAEEILEEIPDEGEREDPPPQVGTMYYDMEDQQIEELDWDLPDIDEIESERW